ncbi:MAG: polysaccharide biosynthesis C-terminal domain-containing protein [Bacteroidota bacterium]
MISKSFIKSSFIYSFIGALPLASSFILFPFYTIYLSKTDVGLLAMYLVFTALFQIILNFGLDNYIPISYVNNKDNIQKQKQTISSSVTLLLLVGIFFTILFFFTGEYVFKLFDPLFKNKSEAFQFFPWGFFCVLTAFFNSVFKSYTNLLINQQRPMRFFWCNITNFVLTIGISLTGIYLYPHTLIGPMYGRLLSGLGIFVIAIILFSKEFGFRFHKFHLKEIWTFCYPMAIYFLILWVLANVDKYILLYYTDASTVAILAAAMYCTQILDFFQNGLSSAIFPKIYNIWNQTKVTKSTIEVNRYYNGLTFASITVLPVFLLLIPFAIILFIKDQSYYACFYILPILTIAFITRGLHSMFYTPLLYFKKTKSIPKVFFISAIFQIILNIVLIKYFGIMGVAITIFVVKIIQTVLLYFESRKIFTFKFNLAKQILLPVVYLASVLILFPFTTDHNRVYINLIQLLIVLIFSYSVFKTDIDAMIQRYIKVKK